MKHLLFPALLLGSLLSLGSCQKDQDPQAATGTGLPGTWRLIDRQCYCLRTPLPNETVTFTDSTYRFTGKSQALYITGSYFKAPVTLCGIPGSTPGLHLLDAVANIGPRQAQATLRGDTLVLDYGSPCDAPRDTYLRQKQQPL